MSKSLKERKIFWKEKISKSKIGHSVSLATRNKISTSLKGNVPWNKGRGHLTKDAKKVRNSIEFSLWRNAVFARDNWTCQKCLVKGGYLHPHHIKNFASFIELRFAIDNGITLCIEDHKLFHKIYGQRNNSLEQIKNYTCKKNLNK